MAIIVIVAFLFGRVPLRKDKLAVFAGVKSVWLVHLLALFHYISRTTAFAVPEDDNHIRKGDNQVVSDERGASAVKVIFGKYVCEEYMMLSRKASC